MKKTTSEGLELLYSAARRWLDAALVNQDSLFTPGRKIWIPSVIDDFYQRFVTGFDASEGSFDAKIERQLSDATPETKQLAAEVLYFHLLPGNTTGGDRKRELVSMVLNWIPNPPSIPEDLSMALNQGLFAEGTSWRTHRFFLVRYLMEFVRRWWGESDEHRAKMLSDAWSFKAFAMTLPLHAALAQADALMHLAFPEVFEDIISKKHKAAIVEAFSSFVPAGTEDIDRKLLAIRQALTPEHGKGFSFYSSQLKLKWQEPTQAGDDDAADDLEEIRFVEGEDRRYWKVAPGEKAKFWGDCLKRNMMCVGWSKLGDLTDVSKEEFEASLPRIMAENGYRKGCRVVWTFAKKIKEGDYVIANKGTSEVLGIGKVTGKYFYDPTFEYAHCIPVEWINTTPRSVSFGHWVGTLKRVSPEDFQIILGGKELDPDRKGGHSKPPVVVTPPIEPPGIQPVDPIVSLLLHRMNVVLHGPPGTGKTHKTLQVADGWKAWQGPDSVAQVTFHPSYSYEDFIEGFRPDASGRFSLQQGTFVRCCDLAKLYPRRNFLLVIDELNRGDVARIFGELITLIERDKRNERASRTLPYSRKPFYVPANLYILGTMNTADRSISLLDIAIRRRFCFVECPPIGQVIADSKDCHQEIMGVDLAKLMNSLNARLQKHGVERDRAIGHSHFLIQRNGIRAIDELRSRLRHDIVPLIEEYCYANRSQLSSILGAIMKDGVLADDLVSDDKRFVAELLKLCDSVI